MSCLPSPLKSDTFAGFAGLTTASTGDAIVTDSTETLRRQRILRMVIALSSSEDPMKFRLEDRTEHPLDLGCGQHRGDGDAQRDDQRGAHDRVQPGWFVPALIPAAQ